jgi:hypothetical protein
VHIAPFPAECLQPGAGPFCYTADADEALDRTRELAKRMFRQILVGFSISLCNIVIHALVMTAVVQVVRIAACAARIAHTWHMVAVMIATVAVLMFAHASEVVVWSLAYAAIGAAPAGADVRISRS